jgi:serine/threonine-protein kinase
MKPNNIVVTADDEVKLIDLGQSCRVDTVKERIQGTPDFIAPEQVHCRPITARTDVYNLGASMYWILTRRHIPTALGSSTSLLGKIDDNLIEKPKPAIELNPRIPAMLNDLIMHCLEIDPEKRPKDMKLVADKLNLIRAKLHAMKNGPAPETMESREDSAP